MVAAVASYYILNRAVHGLDQEWDTFAYHLPFAARLAGLCDKACYEFVWWHEDRFAGFPMFATWLQSVVWRFTGKPDWNDLTNLVGLAVLVATARLTLRTPAALLLTAFLAVPLIQIHASATYIDLFANAMVATAFVLLVHAYLDKAAPLWRVLIPLVPLAVATNSKYQMLPIAASLAFAATALFVARLRGRPTREIAWAVGAYVLLGLITLATYIINLITHGSPIFPVAFELFGIALPGRDNPVNPEASLSLLWEDTPRQLVWLASIFEIEAYVGRLWVWDVGQGYVGRDNPSFRMGGYFGIYVIANLVLFGHLVRNTVKPVAAAAIGVLMVSTLVTAFLPANHELRYYMYWMMFILIMNAILATRPELARVALVQSGHRQVFNWIVLVAFAGVTAISNARYLGYAYSDPTRQQIAQLGVEARVAESFIDGKLHCLGNGLAPFRFLYADIFHPGRDFRVRELVGNESAPPADCDVIIP